ncbi:hypothetical protein [Lacticaseibacillus rhamnosus]|uniref:Phage lysin n=1 Tax=Lacticaseibacillus rhamnosus LRHMDP3 TaxID=1203259 RepID=A0AB33XSP6_LACRH|nr:hypothetical protein [Lacticaseibacillus rhamnosus]EKS49731.1 Phage lysin [Lacticaseibacillus rhamnosus LRHMDP3]OFM43372.1 hypothetical protein HMPREF2691_12010 [Lactobacillus sp. HMSC077C11]
MTISLNYDYFPSFDDIGAFKFASTHHAGGFEGNVDLTDITDNAFNDSATTESGRQPANSIRNPLNNTDQQANDTRLKDIKTGDIVKVSFDTNRRANGIVMSSWVHGKT